MSKPHDFLLIGKHFEHGGARFFSSLKSLDQGHGRFISAAMQWTSQRANTSRNARVEVGERGSTDAACERGSVELVFCVQDERNIESPSRGFTRCITVQQS